MTTASLARTVAASAAFYAFSEWVGSLTGIGSQFERSKGERRALSVGHSAAGNRDRRRGDRASAVVHPRAGRAGDVLLRQAPDGSLTHGRRVVRCCLSRG